MSSCKLWSSMEVVMARDRSESGKMHDDDGTTLQVPLLSAFRGMTTPHFVPLLTLTLD